MSGLSPIANLVPGRRLDKIVKRVPWGVCLHTTGGGVVAKAKKTGKTPIRVALDVYLASQAGANGYPWGGPGYVIAHDGGIWQLAEDTTRTQHVGSFVEGHDRRAEYLSGEWLKMCSAEAVAQWKAAWGKLAKSPQHLFPSRAPNTDLVGIEMIPVGEGFGKPMAKGLKFTKAQHDAAVRLCMDIARRNAFPMGWWKQGDDGMCRLVGHESVGLIDRHDSGGGWDPGALRSAPYFDMNWIKEQVTTRW